MTVDARSGQLAYSTLEVVLRHQTCHTVGPFRRCTVRVVDQPNSLIREHMPATFFDEYQGLRSDLMATLSNENLAFRLGGSTMTLGALCREIGDIEHTYVESFRTFTQDFSYTNPDPALETSVAALVAWFADLDRRLLDAVAGLSEADIAGRHIVRGDFSEDFFSPLPAIQLDIYREALLIFYGKVSVYLRAMGRALPGHCDDWIG
jgi:hypothetical protein